MLSRGLPPGQRPRCSARPSPPMLPTMNDTPPTTPSFAPEVAAVHENVLGRRIVAAIIDILLLSVIAAVFIALWGDTETSDGQARAGLSGLPFVAYLVVCLGYYALLEVATGQTVGKMIMGLTVASADGGEAGPGAIVLRNVLRIIDALPFLYIVGLITAAVSKRNQRVGDLAARTVVVRKPR